MRVVPLAVFSLVALASTTAAADEEDVSTFVSKPTAVYAVLGFGTPVGFLGAEVERTLEPMWTISAGAGWGAAGPQASAMTHVLLGPSGRSKFAVGAGISGGKYSWRPFCVDCDEDAPKTGSVMWGNVEIGGEHRFGSGFALRYFGGYGHIVMGDLTCDPKAGNCPYSPSDGRNLIYTGVALGGAL